MTRRPPKGSSQGETEPTLGAGVRICVRSQQQVADIRAEQASLPGRERSDASAHRRTSCTIARMFPSVSLNHAVFAPPAVAMPLTVLMAGVSYSSKVTPRAFRSATSRSTSASCQNAWLARLVPAFGVG